MYKLSAILFFAILGSVIMPLYALPHTGVDLRPTDTVNKWDDGVIPLEIKGNYSPADLKVINEAIDSIHKDTCVKFVPRASQENYVTIQNTPTGCWATVGQLGGQQKVNFETPQCTENVGSIQHELIHVLGFVHAEHDEGDFYNQHGHDAHHHGHSHGHDHVHDHEDDHEHNHDDSLSKTDIDNINKKYNCEKPTGVQAPLTVTA